MLLSEFKFQYRDFVFLLSNIEEIQFNKQTNNKNNIIR